MVFPKSIGDQRLFFQFPAVSVWPSAFDSTSSKSMFDRSFGHFMRVLVDINLVKELTQKILLERVGLAFFTEEEYEKLPDFCTHCKVIGHQYDTCMRRIALATGKGIPNVDKAQQNRVNEEVILEARKVNVEVQNVVQTSVVSIPLLVIVKHNHMVPLVEAVLEPHNLNLDMGNLTSPPFFQDVGFAFAEVVIEPIYINDVLTAVPSFE